MPVGLYISIPFCRTKCSYCNFASDVFSKSAYENYVGRLLEDIAGSGALPTGLGCVLDERVDSIYLGGGTPSILDDGQLLRIFQGVRDQFSVVSNAEIIVECAPGTLTSSLIDTLLRAGVNRVSLGVQSFVDQEAQSVGRLHKRSTVLEEVACLRAAGLPNINIDLIAGLPHQTAESWTFSLEEAIALGAPHASVYMLEVDEDSRLGRELIAGGTKYHAHFVPDEAATADFYLQACETLNSAGIAQYEISNFARAGSESRHNLKYWTRQPYIGFGVDAHSMLRPRDGELSDVVATSAAKAADEDAGPTAALKRCATQKPISSATQNLNSSAAQDLDSSAALSPNSSATQKLGPCVTHSASSSADQGLCLEAVRFATPDSLDAYMNRAPHIVTAVSQRAAIEESFFLGLRLNSGIDLDRLSAEFTADEMAAFEPAVDACLQQGLLERRGERLRLTPRGRLLSNEVFARFLMEETKAGTGHVHPR